MAIRLDSTQGQTRRLLWEREQRRLRKYVAIKQQPRGGDSEASRAVEPDWVTCRRAPFPDQLRNRGSELHRSALNLGSIAYILYFSLTSCHLPSRCPLRVPMLHFIFYVGLHVLSIKQVVL